MAYRVKVQASRCENKRECVALCLTDVFEMAPPKGVANPLTRLKIRLHGGQVATAARASDCVCCMACVAACPEQAITVEYA